MRSLLLFEGGRIRSDILNEISIVLTTIFSLNKCDNCNFSYKICLLFKKYDVVNSK